MSRNFKPLFLSALAFSAAACAGDSPAGPRSAPSILNNKIASGVVTRPAGGKCTTSFAPISFVFPLSTLDIDGVCNLKHLGRTTTHAIQVVNVLTGEITNSATYTAANGDVLYTTFAGTSSPPPYVVFQGTETLVDGTGRFAGATGLSDLEGTATVDATGSGTGEYTTKGFITY